MENEGNSKRKPSRAKASVSLPHKEKCPAPQDSKAPAELVPSLLAEAFQYNPVPMIIMKMKDRLCVEINAGCEEFLGRKRNDLVGKCLVDIDFIDSIMGKMLHSGLAPDDTQHYTFPFAAKGGELKYGAFTVTRRNVAHHDYLFISITDMRARQESSGRFNGFDEVYEQEYEKTSDAVLLIADDRFYDANPAAVALLQYKSAKELIVRSPAELFPPQQPDGNNSEAKFRRYMDKARKGIGELFEWVFQRADGTVFFTEVQLGRIVLHDKTYLQACVREITDRKEQEAALRQSNEIFQILAENAPLALLIIDEHQVFTYISPWYTRMFGYSMADTPKCESALKALYPDATERQKIGQVWNAARRQKHGEIKSLRATQVRCKDGSYKTVQIISTILADGCCLLIFLDITDLIESEQLYERSRKLESVSTLAGGIAHDFNNLLATVLGYIELARMDIGPEDETMKHLMAAEWALQQTTELTHRLITFAKGGQPFKKIFHPADLITEELQWTDNYKTLKKEVFIGQDIWCIDADEGQIRQVVKSLVANAIEAMDGKGTMTIWMENLTVTAADRLPINAGPYIMLSIQDTGRGIAPKDLRLIFDPYYSTKKQGAQRGTGLGLSVAYSIINKHGGHIAVESTEGKGSCFRVYLPAILQKTVEVKAEKKLDGKKGRILVMDDDPLFAEMMRDMVTAMVASSFHSAATTPVAVRNKKTKSPAPVHAM
jgi:PAS domain S-box-containing protein